MEPLVSIVCITYNHANYIRNALDGMLMQRINFPVEIIVHDDASTDGTQDIIREYETAYPDIFNVIYQKENQYQKAKSFTPIDMNFITPRIRGKYTAACEGDDYWFDPNKLQMQVDYMEKHKDCACSFHPVVWVSGIEEDRVTSTAQGSALFERDVKGEEVITPNGLNVPTCSRVCRADILKEWPEFRKIADIGDLPGKFLLASHGYFHYFPNVMGVYRWNHVGSWNSQFRENKDFAINNAVTGLRWTYSFHKYCKGKHVVAIGKTMLYQIVLRLDRLNAVGNFPWLLEIVTEAHAKKDKMLELEKLAKNAKNNKVLTEKHKAAEKEFYSWFVNAVGEGLKKANLMG